MKFRVFLTVLAAAVAIPFLAFGQQLHAVREVLRQSRLVEQLVELRIVVAGVVAVASIRPEEVEKMKTIETKMIPIVAAAWRWFCSSTPARAWKTA